MFIPEKNSFYTDMIQITTESSVSRETFRSNSASMDLHPAKFIPSSPPFAPNNEPSLQGSPSFRSKNKENPFLETLHDPFRKLNLGETADFVKAFPVISNSNNSMQRGLESGVGQRRVEAPPTPGRPFFNFSAGNLSRKSFPSKWDDAEKWVLSSSCNESPAHVTKPAETSNASKQNDVFQQKADAFAEKKVSSSFAKEPNSSFLGISSEVLLKDKFTDNVEPIFHNFRYTESTKEGFLFRNSISEAMKDAATEVVDGVQHRDVGTEMTPFGSSTTSRCHTPFKSSSPARQNTPTTMSGSLVGNSSNRIPISEVQNRHFVTVEPRTQFNSLMSTWSSREEEEEEISRSLRHFEIGVGRKTAVESKASIWEEEEKKECCIRYRREEAKIQAWVNLQSAKAEAESRKLEEIQPERRKTYLEKLEDCKKCCNLQFWLDLAWDWTGRLSDIILSKSDKFRRSPQNLLRHDFKCLCADHY